MEQGGGASTPSSRHPTPSHNQSSVYQYYPLPRSPFTGKFFLDNDISHCILSFQTFYAPHNAKEQQT